MTADPARRAAVDVVLAVDRDAAYANLLLPRILRERHIAGVDAAFATELAYGTLRWQGVLDAVIEAGARRAVPSIDPPVRAALRLGAYQLLRTRVPPHAAVSTTVDLVRDLAGPRPAGFGNAVMRRISERSWADWVDRLMSDADPLARVAFENGYPVWIATALLDALDGDRQALAELLALDRPATHLLARPGRIEPAVLASLAGPEASLGRLSPYAVHLPAGDPGGLAPVQDGRARVQDEGSQLVALMLTRAPLTGSDQGRWLDMCAGPGGKASLLADLLPIGGSLLAADAAAHRAGLAARGLVTSRGTAVVADGTRPAWRAAAFDRVLVDVPCTGLGSLRRRPEVRWRRTPDDVGRLGPIQRRLLTAAIDSVRPGGVVGYATCSPHRAETHDVIADVVGDRDDVEILDAVALLPEVGDLSASRYVQLWPHRDGTDAMFLALLRRESFN